MGRREELLDSAIEVVATGGMRALTHRAVDKEAGLPAGATSNVFRTRTALVQGILLRIADREVEVWEAMRSAPSSGDVDALGRQLTSLVERLCRHHRSLELARRAVLADATINSELQGVLSSSGRVVADWALERFTRVGSQNPRDDALVMLAIIDGVIGERLAGSLQRRHTARAIDAALRGLLAP